jgi:ribonucleoside-diphosphate reductase alpha chain
MKYARYLPELNRRETWEEIVDRNKEMHLKKFSFLKDEIEEKYKLVYEKKVLPSLRSMQFAGKAVDVNNARLFNCGAIAINSPDAFSELMFLLLTGVGVGISVQKSHVEQLPEVIKPIKRTRKYLIMDSIIGWADAIKILVKSYFYGTPKIRFDFSDIRPKGSPLVTSGGKAPGPQPLMDCIYELTKILDSKEQGTKLTPFECHLMCCHIADAVLAGGIRRAALISMFSLSDTEMFQCKYSNWFEQYPCLARANNSAIILRHKITKKKFFELWDFRFIDAVKNIVKLLQLRRNGFNHCDTLKKLE